VQRAIDEVEAAASGRRRRARQQRGNLAPQPARRHHASVLRRVMEVNFFGAVHLHAGGLPSSRAAAAPVVAISSVAGFSPLVGRTGYAASKHALHGFFDSLRARSSRSA
jgi:NAD(P)-dependent dehydrogenase (short-subunit alcohol dehydrogenase family)